MKTRKELEAQVESLIKDPDLTWDVTAWKLAPLQVEVLLDIRDVLKLILSELHEGKGRQ